MRTTTEQLKALRHRLKLSQAQASSLAGVPLKTWHRWDASLEASHHTSPPCLAANFLALVDIMVNDLKIPMDVLKKTIHLRSSQCNES